MTRCLLASIALLALPFAGTAQVFPPDFGKPKLNINPIALPDGTNVAPNWVMVSSQTSSGGSNTFTVRVSDQNGWNDLKNIYLIVNSTLATANACFIHVDASQRTVRLANDKADAWTSFPAAVSNASKEVLSNTNCSLSVAGVLITPNYSAQQATELSIILPITFSPGFAGVKNFYTFAEDFGGLSMPWASTFTYKVPGQESPVAVVGSASVAVFNNSVYMSFNAGIQDVNGWTDLKKAFFLINNGFTTANGCLLELDMQARTVRLANDAATDWLPTTNILQQSNYGNMAVGNLSNANCELGPNSIGFTGYSQGQVSLGGMVILKNFTAGSRQIHLYAEDLAGTSSGWKEVAQVMASSLPPGTAGPDPNAGKNAPSIGNDFYTGLAGKRNSSELIKFSAQDKDPVGDISIVYMLVNTSATGANGCLVEYDRFNRRLRLAEDNGTSWLPTSLTPGSSATLENSQCILDGRGSDSTSFSSSEYIQMALNVRAKTGFAGTKSIYGFAVDKTGRDSGWVALTTWDVPGLVPPTVAVNNSMVDGSMMRFSLSANDRNGSEEIRKIRAVFGSSATSIANSCLIEVSRVGQSWSLVLANDAGSVAGMPSLSSGGILTNNQCSVSDFTIYNYQENLSLSLVVRALPAYAGNRQLFASALDGGGLDSGWIAGSVVAVSAQVAPAISQLSVINSTTPFASMQVQLDDPNGLDSKLVVDLLVGNSTSPAGQCWASYSSENGTWRLNDEAGSSLQTPSFRLGTNAASLANSRCKLLANGAREPYPYIEASRTMVFAFHFLPAFAGTKTVYGRVSDSTGLSSGWVNLGSYTNPGAEAPTVELSSPGNGSSGNSGTTLALSSRFGDVNGVEFLRNGYILINSSLSGANGCFIWMDFVNKQVRLANDAGTGWLPTGVPLLGSSVSSPIENSNCRVSVSNGSEYAYSSYWNWSIAFKQVFSGPKRVYYFAENQLGKAVGWAEAFGWSVPGKAAPTMVTDFSVRLQEVLAQVNALARDENGGDDLKRVSVLVGSSLTAPAQCRAEYRFDTKQFSLYKDDGIGILASGSAGASTNLENSRCVLILGNSREDFVTNRPTDRMVGFNLKLKSAAADIFAVFGKAEDLAEQSSDWKTLGTWTTMGNSPPAISLLQNNLVPSFSAGYDAQLNLRVSDLNGIANLKTAYFIFRDGNTTANACFVGIDLENKLLRLAADSGQAWVNQTVSIPFAIGGLNNSQCSINAITLGSEFNWTTHPTSSYISIGIRFNAAFRGTKRLEAYIEDKDGLNSRWLNLVSVPIQ